MPGSFAGSSMMLAVPMPAMAAFSGSIVPNNVSVSAVELLELPVDIVDSTGSTILANEFGGVASTQQESLGRSSIDT